MARSTADHTVTVAARLDAELASRFKAAAAKRGERASPLLAELINRYLDEGEPMDSKRRDEVLDAAVKAGKIPERRREHYERAWDAGAKATEKLLDELAPGLTPGASAPTASGEVSGADMRAMFGRPICGDR